MAKILNDAMWHFFKYYYFLKVKQLKELKLKQRVSELYDII